MRPVFALLPSSLFVFIFIGLLVGWWLIMRLRKAAGIWRLRYFAYPRPWLKQLHDHVPMYSQIPWELRAPYQDCVLHFIDSKGFRPCGALDEVPEAARIVIAGNACVLLLNGSGTVYPDLLTVQVFPPDDPDAEARSSCIALHWDESKKLATDPRDKGNTALPQIALRLGWEAAGRPALPDPLRLTPWARMRCAAFSAENPGLLEKTAGSSDSGEPFLPGDIFAVATEMFLGAPALLQQRQPELYNRLRLFYKVDPARWKRP